MATKVKLIETGAVTGNIIPDGCIATGKLANDAVTTKYTLAEKKYLTTHLLGAIIHNIKYFYRSIEIYESPSSKGRTVFRRIMNE